MAVHVHGSISSCVRVKNIYNYMEDNIKTHTSCSAMSLITKLKISLVSQTPLTLRWRGLARETSSKSDSEHLKVHDCFL